VKAPDLTATYNYPNVTSGNVGVGYTQPVYAADGKTVTSTNICTMGAQCACGPSATPQTNPAPCVKSGTSANVNAGYLPAAGAVVPGAMVISYEIGSVSVDPVTRNPSLTFRMLNGTTPVTFQANTNAELLSNVVGAPSIYFVYALTQDGITAPADFNGSASAYLKDLWKGNKTVTPSQTSGTNATALWTGKNASGTSLTDCSAATGPCVCSVRNACTAPSTAKVVPGTLSVRDANGFYTVVLTGTKIPAAATKITGGVGYSYSLTSTQPLTQTDVAGYVYNTTTKMGGLVIAAPNVAKPLNAADVRRPVVSNAKCNACHAQLGAGPTFHAGQRNDAPTCSWCHKPNQASSGWSANVSTFIHGIHGGEARSTPFMWHATCNYTTPTSYQAPNGTCTEDGTNTGAVVSPKTYGPDVTYPGRLTDCGQCHLDDTFSFGTGASAAAVPGLLWTTVATGTFTASPAQNPAVPLATNFGLGYSINNYTGDYVDAEGATLVTSPVSAACYSCHDTAGAKSHMESKGGFIYKPRSTAMAGGTSTELCLDCHSAGMIWGVDQYHQ
jgi:OmcA/MtrC family decaheme c-type cytochrome